NLKPGFMLDLMYKDLGLISAMGRDLEVPLPMANLAREVVNIARQEGMGKLDWTAILTLYEKWAGVRVRLAEQGQ
ncbi:MAG TPA: NAD-binding protein, partial [Chloroflexota bacterium]